MNDRSRHVELNMEVKTCGIEYGGNNTLIEVKPCVKIYLPE